MPRFRIDNIAALARQMAFTPADTRLAQLARTEDLLHTLDAAKAYPLEFVVFRITGYRPKSIQSSLLTGLALQHDLGLLIETVSESLDLKASDVPEPVLAIEDVTERFNVTAKTIQRWRRRGLPARRFIFSDGRRRVGFLVSSVERFLSERGELVARGTNFSQVDDVERSEILRRARRLSLSCQCCHNEISRRVARRFNRSPLTILHTIRRHDELDPDHAIFASSPTPIGDDDRTRIVRAFRKGVPVGSLARRFCRTRSQVYRVILDERLSRLTNRKVKFIDDPLYHQPEAAEVMEHLVRAGAEASESATDQRVPRDLPGYLQELYRTPLLSAALERALFLKFNFHKYQYVQARRKLEPQFARARDLNVLDAHLQRAIDTKNAIVRANLRLVVSIARRHLRPGLSLTELISDGSLTLMRAVESFDVHKGNKFSTYATLALMKGLARSVPAMQAKASRLGDARRQAMDSEPADRGAGEPLRRIGDRDALAQLLSRLPAREHYVLLSHYGLDDAPPDSYELLGQRLGISTQRVRQIERSAIDKLRSTANHE